jgi:uncharacterized protein (UPF0218 family)
VRYFAYCLNEKLRRQRKRTVGSLRETDRSERLRRIDLQDAKITLGDILFYNACGCDPDGV